MSTRKGIMSCSPIDKEQVAGWISCYIQPKLNGDRCLAEIDSAGQVTLLSSEGRIITSVPHISDALQSIGLRDITLDGELYIHGRPHEYIHGIVSRKNNNLHPDYQEMEYHVFDVVLDLIQSMRLEKLNEIFLAVPESSPIKKVQTARCFGLNEVDAYGHHFLSQGYEGYILRHGNKGYIRTRSPALMKFKPRGRDSYAIIGFQEEFSKIGQPKNRLGALICQKGVDQFKIGTGFTVEQRMDLWENRDTLQGKMVEISYECATSNNRGVLVFVQIK